MTMDIQKGSFTVYDKTYNVMSVGFERGVYIWVGDENQMCNELHCGFPLKNIQGETSVGSTMLGDIDSISADLSKSLAKKLNTAVFMSFNIPETDISVLAIVQEKLYDTVLKMLPKHVEC